MKLSELKDITIEQNVPLSKFTFTKTGGPAEFLVFPKDVEELKIVLSSAKEEKLPITVIGNASNLIIRDGGIKGLVIILTDMKTIRVVEDEVIAEAGARIIDTSNAAREASLSGLEFAAGIPGSVGGAIFMNAGAYGGEIKDCLYSAITITKDGQLKEYSNQELNFRYRHSLIQENDEIVISGTFKLEKGEYEVIAAEMKRVNDLRAAKQPLEYPSCGSVFKRPKGYFVGPLIIEAGLQGFQIGGAQISKKHAGFIVNIDHATATDYLDVIHHVQETIFAQKEIKLEPEVRIIGRDKD